MRRSGLGVLVLAMLAGTSVPTHAAMTAEERIRRLERLIEEQQQEIRELKGELKQQKAIGNATQQQAERAEEQAKTVEKKTASFSIPEWVSKFTLFGDVRFRFEGFYNQPTTAGVAVTANNRERLRARLGLRFAPSDEISATVRLATGSSSNPISQNITLSGEFTPKTINLDWAFITLTPGKTFGIRPGLVTLVGGKFQNPIFRPDELVFDEDLAPEGTYETIAFLGEPLGELDQVKLHLLQWTVQQVSTGGSGWMIGGQLNPRGHIGPVQLEAGLGQYYWIEPDLIAQAINTNSQLINTNQVTTAMVSGKKQIVGYVGAFSQTNVAATATIPNALLGRPLRLFGDYVWNWKAESDALGVLGGLQLGETKKRGDWALTAMYEYLEQQAVLSVFSWSDFGNGGTNQQGPVLSIGYQLLDPLTLTARGYFTNFVDTPKGFSNPTQTRLQLDAQVKF